MIFSSLFSHREQRMLWALIDIQSGLVRGSVVLFEPGKIARILYTSIHPIAKKTTPDASQISKIMLHSVEEVAHMLAREGLSRARALGFQGGFDGTHYVLSSPWVISQTRSVKLDFERPTVITNAVVQEIINKARTEVNVGDVNFDPVLIEQKIFDVKLNGYSVTKFEGKSTSQLEVSFAISVSSKKLMSKISGAAHQALHTKAEHYHSALLLEYAGIRGVLQDFSEYMIIHMHSELTDLVVIKNGMCTFISSFPMGTSTFIRKLAKAMHTSEASADSTLTLFDGKKLSTLEEERITPLIHDIGKGWLHSLHSTLSLAGDTLVIPRTIILSTHSHYKAIEAILKNSDLKPNIRPLELSMIESSILYERGQDRSLRMGIYSIAISSFS